MSDASLPPAGWYPEANGQRFWDGEKWTEHRAPYQAPQLPFKNVGIAYLFFLLLGGFGAHQFYLRNYGAAITQLSLYWVGILTLFFYIGAALLLAVLIWWLIDLFTLPSQVQFENRRLAEGR